MKGALAEQCGEAWERRHLGTDSGFKAHDTHYMYRASNIDLTQGTRII